MEKPCSEFLHKVSPAQVTLSQVTSGLPPRPGFRRTSLRYRGSVEVECGLFKMTEGESPLPTRQSVTYPFSPSVSISTSTTLPRKLPTPSTFTPSPPMRALVPVTPTPSTLQKGSEVSEM